MIGFIIQVCHSQRSLVNLVPRQKSTQGTTHRPIGPRSGPIRRHDTSPMEAPAPEQQPVCHSQSVISVGGGSETQNGSGSGLFALVNASCTRLSPTHSRVSVSSLAPRHSLRCARRRPCVNACRIGVSTRSRGMVRAGGPQGCFEERPSLGPVRRPFPQGGPLVPATRLPGACPGVGRLDFSAGG